MLVLLSVEWPANPSLTWGLVVSFNSQSCSFEKVLGLGRSSASVLLVVAASSTDLSDGNSNSPETKGACFLAFLVAWSFWCERTRRTFNDEVKTPSRIFDKIKMSRLWVSAGAKHRAFLVDRSTSE